MSRIIVLISLAFVCPAFASNARLSKQKCIKGMDAAVVAAGQVFMDAKSRTGKVNVDDDMQMIHEMGELSAAARAKFDDAKKSHLIVISNLSMLRYLNWTRIYYYMDFQELDL